MKFLLFILLSTGLFSSDLKTDECMWANAYYGNVSLVHKMHLLRPAYDINEELLNQFVMAYAYYKAGVYDEIEPIFKRIDSCIEHSLLQITE